MHRVYAISKYLFVWVFFHLFRILILKQEMHKLVILLLDFICALTNIREGVQLFIRCACMVSVPIVSRSVCVLAVWTEKHHHKVKKFREEKAKNKWWYPFSFSKNKTNSYHSKNYVSLALTVEQNRLIAGNSVVFHWKLFSCKRGREHLSCIILHTTCVCTV